jgi:perosamine synthetase
VNPQMDKLAVEGGRPVRATLLPYGRQVVDEDDVQAVTRTLRSNWLTTGPEVDEFEKAFAAVVGASHGVAVANGTAALHASMAALHIGPEDEVIVPALTFVASANCVLFQGGRPVFADVDPQTLLLNPAEVKAKMTSRTKAIIAVDYAGLPCDYDALRKIADQFGLALVADACHALGGGYHGRPVGSLGDLSVFSLHPVKHITCGEGGMITTDDPEAAKRMRIFRNHGITSDLRQRELVASGYYEMEDLGYNYRLTDIQCALGLSQLKKLKPWVARRKQIAGMYSEAFSSLSELEVPVLPGDRDHAWHLYVIRLNLERLRVSRAEVYRALRAENIGVNVHYIPVPWHPFYQRLGYRKGQWPAAEAAYDRILSLPMWPALTDGDVADTIAAVRKVIAAYRK